MLLEEEIAKRIDQILSEAVSDVRNKNRCFFCRRNYVCIWYTKRVGSCATCVNRVKLRSGKRPIGKLLFTSVSVYMKLKDINILDVGNTILMAGAIFTDGDRALLCYFPEEDKSLTPEVMDMTQEDWQTFLRQTDVMETEIIAKASDGSLCKAIYRKSQRQIDASVSWRVFKRDGYSCRYCGKDDVPLTVDHLVLWEDGGPSTVENMVSACKKCNKLRGNTKYEDWLTSPRYRQVSSGLTEAMRASNLKLIDEIKSIHRVHIRTR